MLFKLINVIQNLLRPFVCIQSDLRLNFVDKWLHHFLQLFFKLPQELSFDDFIFCLDLFFDFSETGSDLLLTSKNVFFELVKHTLSDILVQLLEGYILDALRLLLVNV